MGRRSQDKKHEDKKVKVLEVSLVSHNTGGVEKFLYDVFRHFDLGCFDVDFLSPDGDSYTPYEKEIVEKGGRLLDLGVDRVGIRGKLKYNQRLYRFLKNNKYDIVHINSGAFFFCFQVALVAKRCGIKKIITHSHSAVNYAGLKKKIIESMKPRLEKLSNNLLTCSREAGLSLFTEDSINSGKVIYVKNGIQIEDYKFDKFTRKEYQKKLELEDALVYGHIGRFVESKNHSFLLDVFYEIQKRQENAKLILIGEGPLKKKIEEKVKSLGIDDKVVFLGYRNDVNQIVNAFDIFLFPSIYEGLSIVAIEAQTNGVPVYASKGIPEEVKISNYLRFIPLSRTPKEWAQQIVEEEPNISSANRGEAYKNTLDKGFDIQSTANLIGELYLQE